MLFAFSCGTCQGVQFIERTVTFGLSFNYALYFVVSGRKTITIYEHILGESINRTKVALTGSLECIQPSSAKRSLVTSACTHNFKLTRLCSR